MTCRTYADGLMICGPAKTKVVRDESMGVKWCFYCRERVEFRFTVTADVEPSYYDPNPSIDCVNGHWNGDLFPSHERTWE